MSSDAIPSQAPPDQNRNVYSPQSLRKPAMVGAWYIAVGG